MEVPVAQWIARWTSNPEVAGSNPAGDEGFRKERHLEVEFHLSHISRVTDTVVETRKSESRFVWHTSADVKAYLRTATC